MLLQSPNPTLSPRAAAISGPDAAASGRERVSDFRPLTVAPGGYRFMARRFRLPDALPKEIMASGRQRERVRVRPSSRALDHPLTTSHFNAIREAMQLFVDDDVARGLSLDKRLYCVACERVRPAAGFIRYDRYSVCNTCAIEYEVARARGLTTTAGQYVRDKHFGEGDHYSVEAFIQD